MFAKNHLPKGKHAILRKNILGLTAASMLAGVGGQAMAGGPQNLGDMDSGSAKGLGGYMSQAATKAMDTTKAVAQAAWNNPLKTGVVIIGVVGAYALYTYAKAHNFDTDEMMAPVKQSLGNFWEGLEEVGQRATATMGGYDSQIGMAKTQMREYSKQANAREAWLSKNSGDATAQQRKIYEHILEARRKGAEAAQESLQKLQNIKPFSLDSLLGPVRHMADQVYQSLPSVEGFFGSAQESAPGVQSGPAEAFHPEYMGRKVPALAHRLLNATLGTQKRVPLPKIRSVFKGFVEGMQVQWVGPEEVELYTGGN